MKLRTMVTVTSATLFVAFSGIAEAGPPPRLGPPQCTKHTVKSGDTASVVARKAHVKWDEFTRLNHYIEDLNKIWPMDELTLWCPPPVVEVEAKPAAKEEATPAMEVTEAKAEEGVECHPTGRRRWDGSEQCVTPLNVIAQYLRAVGFEGEALVKMLAVTMGESAGDPYASGDRGIMDHTWGPSVGWFQVRTVKKQKGTGGPRDEDALVDPHHQAQSAWRISNGGVNFKPWGAYTNGSYKQFLDEAEEAAHES